ncbi:Lsr2 family protein [Nocardia cyriacigeorgica]|uniref:histone-like nucleoid-structuring protein Lsr2 n=1 Tax=Nocardia cyriacigeorgica TaxID=135487 RepID=UPI001895A516|nr:histone-like nucleoid-structuring protein Lsr2 [Nocardia cyriacigeorgica]MBF6085239.1 Lsr2 family protein [Nocardia cyriacigeorgica]
MATRLIDDLTGELIQEGDLAPAAERRITYNGEVWELDLSRDSVKLLQDMLAPVKDKASVIRTAPGRRKEDPAAENTASEESAADNDSDSFTLEGFPGEDTGYQKHTAQQRRAIREWALANDYEVSSAGYVAVPTVRAFYAAHQ